MKDRVTIDPQNQDMLSWVARHPSIGFKQSEKDGSLKHRFQVSFGDLEEFKKCSSCIESNLNMPITFKDETITNLSFTEAMPSASYILGDKSPTKVAVTSQSTSSKAQEAVFSGLSQAQPDTTALQGIKCNSNSATMDMNSYNPSPLSKYSTNWQNAAHNPLQSSFSQNLNQDFTYHHYPAFANQLQSQDLSNISCNFANDMVNDISLNQPVTGFSTLTNKGSERQYFGMSQKEPSNNSKHTPTTNFSIYDLRDEKLKQLIKEKLKEKEFVEFVKHLDTLVNNGF